MACKGICFRHKAIKPIGRADTQLVKNGAKYVVSLSNGKVFFVPVVDTDFGQNQGTRDIS
ncbi:MAG: hypothetical protein WCE25_06160 [Nitrososphaeraceae archaeon]